MEVFTHIPEFVWGALVALLCACSGALLTYRLSRKQRRDDMKRKLLLQISRNANCYLSDKQNSHLTNLCHSMNEAMIFFSSKKIRLAIHSFLSEEGENVNLDDLTKIINLMCEDIDEKVEWKFKLNRS